MRLKDYYKILGVLPSATTQEIKTAYRIAALKYHPDKNPDNVFSEAHFKELQEAYSTLSHTGRRIKYDEERWLSGMSNNVNEKKVINPQWLLNECIKLSTHIADIDTYRMSHKSLRDYILLLLSDSHIGVLQLHRDTEINKRIINELLKSLKKLDIRFLSDTIERLVLLASGDNDLLNVIYDFQKERSRKANQDRYIPLIVVVATILLCMFMYFYGRKQ